MAPLLKLAYQLRCHRFGAWALDRWGVILSWGAAVVIFLQWMLRGRPVLPRWHWLVLALLVLAGAGLLALHLWAARRSYLVFAPDVGRSAPAPAALAPTDKVPLHAAGRFEVEGRAGFFVYLQAFWRTFTTGEHAVMAIRHPSRFLLLGRTSPVEHGLWYIFIPAEAVERIIPGRMSFGRVSGPALRVIYRRSVDDRHARRGGKVVRETVHLIFEDEPALASVWADLVFQPEGRLRVNSIP